MPLAFLGPLLSAVGGVALNALFKLATEKFLTKAVLIALREGAKRTQVRWDDELVDEMEKALEGPKAARPAA